MPIPRYTWLFCLLGLLFFSSCQPVSYNEVLYEPEAMKFEGERAFRELQEIVSRFPYRHSGTPNNREIAEWMKEKLSHYGLSCQLDAWDIVNYSKNVSLQNVVCRLEGVSEKEILLLAHHDQAPTTIEGADNDASGLSILLELARIFSQKPSLPYTMVFVSTDAEEYGMLGARRYVQTHHAKENIIAGISLDNVGKTWSDGIEMGVLGQFRGYSPLWLLLTAEKAAKKAKNIWIPRIKSPLEQLLDQAVPISFMDQGPLLAENVPALGFATHHPPEMLAKHWETYHSSEDTIEHQSPLVLHQSGRVTEALIRALQTRTIFPKESGPYIYFRDKGLVLQGFFLWFGFSLFIALFFLGSVYSQRKKLKTFFYAWKQALPHFLSLWCPLILSVLLLYIFVFLGIMDTYELYPATAKDKALESPSWTAVLLFISFLAISFSIARKLSAQKHKSIPSFASQKSLSLAVVGVGSLYILCINPFSLILLSPLLLWLFIKNNFFLTLTFFLLGGGVIYMLLFFFGFFILKINFYILWYLMMMFSIGMISFPTAIVITSIIAAGLSLVVKPANQERKYKTIINHDLYNKKANHFSKRTL